MLKRNLIFLVAALFLLIIAGYPAGAWYVGKQMEATLAEQYKALSDFAPFMSVSDRKFKSGIFSSEETLTLNMRFAPGAAPLQFAVTSRMKHLPLTGILSQQTVAIDSEIAFAGSAIPDVAEWTGGQNLATVHTAYYLNGSGNATMTIPAFKSDRLSSEPATLNVRYAKDMASYSMQGNMPRFAIINKSSGARLEISGVQISGDHKRILAGPPSLYSGADHIAIEQIDASGADMPAEPGFIKHVTVDVAATPSSDNEFVDITEKIGLGTLKILGKDYGPAKLELSFVHLHAKTIAGLAQAGWQETGKNSAMATQFIETLFSHSPEFKVDRLSFTRPEGETVVSALVKLKDAQPGDFSNPTALMAKGYASVDFKMPEKLLLEFGQQLAPASMQSEGLDKALEKLLAEGYISREDGYIRTKYEFHDAASWFNGKQYVPPASPVPPARTSRHR